MTATGARRIPIALVALLSVALLINYVDRGSIGIAAPLIQTEFKLSASQVGWVLAAFFWAYAPMQPLMGWLADRIGAEHVLVSGFCVWSIATVLTGPSGGRCASHRAWDRASRVEARATKGWLALRLDADVLEWFKSRDRAIRRDQRSAPCVPRRFALTQVGVATCGSAAS